MSLSFAKPTTRTIIRTLIPIGTALLAFVVTGFLLLAGGLEGLIRSRLTDLFYRDQSAAFVKEERH